MAAESPYHQLDAIAASFGLPPPGAALGVCHGGRSFEVELDLLSSTVQGLTVRAEAADLPAVRFTTESGFDRLGKALGICREVQLDDPTFDPRVYIEADDVPDDAVRALLAPPAARRALVELLTLAAEVRLGARGVIAAVRDSDACPAFDAGRFRTVLDRVATLAEALPPRVGPPPLRVHAPGLIERHWNAALGGFAGFLCVAWCAAALSCDYWKAVHGVERFACALGAGVLVWLLSLVPAAFAVRGKASSFPVFWVVALMLSVALVPAGAAAFVLVNALADPSPIVVHHATIVAAKPYECEDSAKPCGLALEVEPFGASGGTYEVEVAGWPPAPGLTRGARFPVATRAGALGSAYFEPR